MPLTLPPTLKYLPEPVSKMALTSRVAREIGPDVLQLDVELVRDAVAVLGLIERHDRELAFLLDLQALVAGSSRGRGRPCRRA